MAASAVTHTGTELGSAAAHGRLKPALVGAWAFVVTGVGHLALTLLLESPPSRAAVLDDMRATIVDIPPARSLYQLFTGFSMVMALMLIAFGAVLITSFRSAGVTRSVVTVALVAAAAVLVVSVAVLPAPPIAFMAVAVVAFGLALRPQRG